MQRRERSSYKKHRSSRWWNKRAPMRSYPFKWRIRTVAFLLFWLVLMLTQTSLSSSTRLFVQAQQENSQQSYQDATVSDASSSFPVRVELPGLGIVQGVRRFSEEYVVDFFGGIPYAAPPVMNLRWSPPQDVVQWHPHVLDASEYGTDCFQIVDPVMNPLARTDRMSEDCLYLNVFRPALTPESSDEPLPVMLWFHGGAFQQGGANRPEYNARRLAHEEHVIVITVNYRLGALGFLVSRELGLTGNYGLMDQRAAMHFVKQYCSFFGGDPNSITLFGESAGAVMIGLHLMMDTVVDGIQQGRVDGRLFHKAILQSNPMGYQFRSPNVADFLGDALRRAVDCRDLDCMKTESVEEILRAQSSLMGIPRSVGDFFAWGPTLTTTMFTPPGTDSTSSRNTFSFPSSSGRVQREQRRPLFDPLEDGQDDWKDTRSTWTTVSPYASSSVEYRRRRRRRNRKTNLFEVNVTQPLQNLHLIPDDIPIIIGTNKNEGEMFVHGAFPITMSKAVYWMFVGALFKDSAPKVLKHYRPYVAQLEAEAAQLSQQQVQEERNKQYFMEHQHELEEEYQSLLKTTTDSFDKVRGGSQESEIPLLESDEKNSRSGGSWWRPQLQRVQVWTNQTRERLFAVPDPEEIEARKLYRQELAKQKAKEKALKEAAKVAIDYRPVMSRIINDYLFRCPSWHFAHLLSLQRVKRYKEEEQRRKEENDMFSKKESHSMSFETEDVTSDERELEFKNNVYVYRFSQPTHVPGFLECWGKSCHTSELPFVFESMGVIRSDYSTLSTIAQKEAPVPPEYPYTELLAAYQGALEETVPSDVNEQKKEAPASSLTSRLSNYTSYFQNVLEHFFEDYFKEDADEEIAHDMAQRWVSFAKTGSPNYENSKVEWIPWRFVPDERVAFDTTGTIHERSFEDIPSGDREDRQLYNVWRDIEAEALQSMEEDRNHVYTEDEQEEVIGRAYRAHALELLNMEVVEQDSLRTELKRTKQPKLKELQTPSQYTLSPFGRSTNSGENATASLNEGLSNANKDGLFQLASEQVVQQLQRMAQDMGVLGRGLSGEYDRLLVGGGIGGTGSGSRTGSSFPIGHGYWDDDFFPQFLELRWPPEGRLVELDCTCDFWGRIRYRY